MSLVPTSADVTEGIRPFRRGLSQVNQFQRQGYSWSGYERNCCFLNRAGGEFTDASAVSGFDFQDDARAIALTDWDDDGDLDVWVTNRTAPRVRFLSNANSSHHAWLKVLLQGTNCNRDAIGARIELSREVPGNPLCKTLRAGSGYLAQSSKWIHFGLGDDSGQVTLTISWPDGQVDRFKDLEVNCRYCGPTIRGP